MFVIFWLEFFVQLKAARSLDEYPGNKTKLCVLATPPSRKLQLAGVALGRADAKYEDFFKWVRSHLWAWNVSGPSFYLPLCHFPDEKQDLFMENSKNLCHRGPVIGKLRVTGGTKPCSQVSREPAVFFPVPLSMLLATNNRSLEEGFVSLHPAWEHT